MSLNKQRIIFVDDDPRAGELFSRFARSEAFDVEVFRSPQTALGVIKQRPAPALVISDLKMPGMSGIELLQAVRTHHPKLPFILITGYSTMDDAIEALRLGATDFIKKPFDMDELLKLVREQLDRTPKPAQATQRYGGMLGNSAPIRAVYKIIEKIHDVRVNVMIEGESGTGKELAARAVHNLSDFADKPFVVIDCGAITGSLLESELFGHEKGAFTGAHQTKRGLLEVATGGTLFLDEIGNISDAMQTKLLRVVQEQQVTRVGGITPIDIDVRFVVASNRELSALVELGQFRHDLYHRLNVVKLRMPSLRERREDIPDLVQHFLREFAERYHRDVTGFDAESMQHLVNAAWPGNVRELKNLIERHVALAEQPLLHIDRIAQQATQTSSSAPEIHFKELCIDADSPTLEELERRYILKTLHRLEGNRENTARTLGINKSTLWRKLQGFEIE
ncbi:MAG: sigma-54-dependent Fis family transcriptional regulator [Gammaproteobacteria bacterium 28-57-27]|nr:MAG: sigma-54-dependent Fis family transcriptional regulator [Gammaproteobacteria bacterium 28-57-27]